LGQGGISAVARAKGLSPPTIRAGIGEIGGGAVGMKGAEPSRIRKMDGRRECKVDHDSTRLGDLEALVDGCVLLTDSPRLTFSGIGVYRPALFDECENRRFPLAAVIRKAASWGLVTGEHYRGVWIDVGTLARLSQLDASLQGDLRVPC
jgi:hypothetical protein